MGYDLFCLFLQPSSSSQSFLVALVVTQINGARIWTQNSFRWHNGYRVVWTTMSLLEHPAKSSIEIHPCTKNCRFSTRWQPCQCEVRSKRCQAAARSNNYDFGVCCFSMLASDHQYSLLRQVWVSEKKSFFWVFCWHSWIYGFMDSWIRGYMDSWIRPEKFGARNWDLFQTFGPQFQSCNHW